MSRARLTLLSGLFAFAVVAAGPAPAPAAYEREIAAWRAERVAALTKPDGWLSLIGLHFLNEGANRVGSAKDNDVVLAAGPAHVGVVNVAADGAVTLVPQAAAEAKVDGQTVGRAALALGEGARKPTLVTVGTVSFFVIERSGKKALRVKDSAGERRAQFAGLDYFPLDATWRIEARWEAFEKSQQIPLTNILGQVSPALVPGKAVFEREGRTVELLAIDEGPEEPLFFVISDATSGRETYAAARFVYAERAKDGKIVLDFNRAESPPCAFTPFATCPLPPKENRLSFAITAGEKSYRGRHD